MIHRIYRLIDIKRIEMVQRELDMSENRVLVRPDYLSICAADQRYYQGKRKKEILKAKLPLALIHEAVGTVIYDCSGELLAGTKVALVPNISPEEGNEIKGNYRRDSIFMSSGADGFMQDVVSIRRDRIVPLPDDDVKIYVLSELVSIAFNALDVFARCAGDIKNVIGVWGDGSLGFAMALTLKSVYPQSKVYVFGKNMRKLQRFSFADEIFMIDAIPDKVSVDHCFECVGGKGSESAIKQMVERITPEGSISLLGVSEEPIAVPTRMILEKGLRLFGNSRSEKVDFEKAVQLIYTNKIARRYLKTIISQTVDISHESAIATAFDNDVMNDFKTVMRWRI